MRLLPLIACAAILGAASLAAQQVSDESLTRIRERLQQPSSRGLDMPKATFRVSIVGRRPLEDVFAQPPWVPVPDEFAAPKARVGRGIANPGLDRTATPVYEISIDYVALAHAISRSIRTRAARAEMRRAIEEYCSVRRDEPDADLICSQPLPIR